MKLLRSTAALGVFLLFLVIAITDARAQLDRGARGGAGRGGDPGKIPDPLPGEVFDVDCPKCNNKLEVRDTMSSITCSKCGTTHNVVKDGANIKLSSSESSENKWKKPLMIGGGVLLVLGLIGMILKRTVLAPPPPKKKKKKRRDDDDEDDDRPRKKKKPVVLDEDDEAPRTKKKPRIVEED